MNGYDLASGLLCLAAVVIGFGGALVIGCRGRFSSRNQIRVIEELRDQLIAFATRGTEAMNLLVEAVDLLAETGSLGSPKVASFINRVDDWAVQNHDYMVANPLRNPYAEKSKVKEPEH